MAETTFPITEAARLRCSYAELKRWGYEQVEEDLLLPQSVTAVMMDQTVTVEPIPEAQLMPFTV